MAVVRHTRLAKLTRPRLHAPVARARLFRRLDQLRAQPVVWITGPPGAGKTTLVASYLDAARLEGLWYQIDPGDSDPATFFLYLRQAIAAFEPPKSRPLPLLTPEYLPDLPGFARRFFREALSRLPAQTLLVLDNYHELEPDSPLHEAIAAAVVEIPDGSNLIVASRTDPPAAFADAILKESVALLGWADLKLTQDEGAAVAAARGVDDSALARKLHMQTDGWFAGLALLLERARAGESTRGSVRADAIEVVFDFFDRVIFEHADAPMRRVLLVAALLPRAEADLVASLSGEPSAGQSLEDLYQRHLFVERTHGPRPSYRFHALFRAFLRHRAGAALPRAVRAEVLRRAAEHFESLAEWPEAVQLAIDAEDADACARVLLTAAPVVFAQGRWRALLEWISSLPPVPAHAKPWIDYWHGRATVFVDRLAARAMLEEAYETFRAMNDTTGQIRCAVAVMEAIHFRYREFRLMDPWIDQIASLLQGGGYDLTFDDELQAYSALLVAATYSNPEHPILGTARSHVEALVGRATNVNLRVTVAAALHGYENTTVDVSAAELAVRIARPLLASPELTVHTAGFYLAMEGYTEYMHGRYERALACLDEADARIRGEGLAELATNIEHWRALTQRRAGLLDDAEETLQRMHAAADATDLPFAPRPFVTACVAFDRGRHELAVRLVEEARIVTEAGGQFVGLMLVATVCANILIGCGKHDLAAEYLDGVRSRVTGPVTDHYLGAVELNDAWLAHRTGDTVRRNARLGEALRRSRDPRARERIRWYPNALADLMPIALEESVEADAAIELIRAFQIKRPESAPERWPCPIRVFTLGPFRVEIDDVPLTFGRKLPKRTLALLKALVAFGGRNVPEARLLDALWPQEDADDARRSLGAALHRLRGLLGCGDAFRQSGAMLTINRDLCWVDALSLDDVLRSSAFDDRVLGLYRGMFLEADTDEPWALPMRERWRARFVAAVERVGRGREESGVFAEALSLYERGLEADPLIEGFHQGLMRCWLGLGRPAEAGSAYRRLQRTLAVALGSEPSPASRAILEPATRVESGHRETEGRASPG